MVKPLGEALGKVLQFDPERWVSWNCPGCGEPMQQPAEVPTFEQVVGRPCERCEKPAALLSPDRERALAACGCPIRYRQTTFVEPAAWPRDSRHPGVDLGAWRGEPWCVLLGGVVEGGKTMLATELFWRALPGKRSAVWCRAVDVIQRLYGAKPEERREEWELFTTSGLLLVDDIGRGHEGGAWDTVTELVAARYDAMRPTIFTTNRRIAPAKKGEKKSLADEDAALFRRLKDGLIAGVTEPWRPRT